MGTEAIGSRTFGARVVSCRKRAYALVAVKAQPLTTLGAFRVDRPVIKIDMAALAGKFGADSFYFFGCRCHTVRRLFSIR